MHIHPKTEPGLGKDNDNDDNEIWFENVYKNFELLKIV